jgi:O-antigen ligase
MKKREVALLVLVGALVGVWPVSHTISLRDALLVLGLGLGGFLVYRHRPVPFRAYRDTLAPALLAAGALTLWMIAVALLVSPEPAWSLDELRGQWVKAMAALVFGGLAAASLRKESPDAGRLLLVIGGVLLVHIVAIDVDALLALFRGDNGYRAAGVTGGPDKASYLTNILLALLFAEWLARTIAGKRLLPLSSTPLFVISVLTLISLYVERIRNGVGAALVMALCAALLYLLHRARQRRMRQSTVALLVCAGVALAGGLTIAIASVKPGTSWKQLVATIPLALATQEHKGWLDEKTHGLPTLPDGSAVDVSAYVRIAWFAEGLRLSAEHPLGVGFGRNAFGHAVAAKYGTFRGHSHSSFIDLLVGIGIPGVLLWLGFLISLLWLAWRGAGGGWGYALLFVVVDFGTRMLVDSNVRDHTLQTFMFLAGVFGVLVARNIAPAPRRKSTRR